MERIRILIAQLPAMLSDIVETAITQQADMLVVGHTNGDAELSSAAARVNADLVLVPVQSEAELGPLDEALRAQPRLKILGITRDGRSTYLRELCPRTITLGNIGPEQLADVIRRTVREGSPGC